MVVPPNAAYISRDGLVTFDENGRKLDSLGNVAWADTQTLKGADARPLERPAAPPPPPQAQRAAAAVAPPLTPQRFFPEVAPPSTALGMPQSGPVRPGMTDYPKPLSAPSSFGPAQAGQGGGGSNSWESQVYMPGYQGQGIATETGGRRIGPPTTPFASDPNRAMYPTGGPQTMGGGYTPDILRPGTYAGSPQRPGGLNVGPGYSPPYVAPPMQPNPNRPEQFEAETGGRYVGPSTTDTSSWQAPQPGVDPWAVAPGAPYTPPNAGGYPDNVKAEAQRSAPRFDDGTQWGYTSPQQPPGPVGPGPVGGREYWERGGRSPIQSGMDMMQFKYDEVRPRNPLIGQSPNQGYGPSSPMQGTQPFQGYAPPQNPLSGQQPGQGYGPPPGGREYWERGGFNPIESGMNMMQYQYDERRPRNPLIGLPPFYGYGG